jgi:hypothetical protein
MRRSPEEAYNDDKRAIHASFSHPSSFVFTFILLFLLDSGIALESKTSSLFLTFSYSVTL